MPNPQRRPRSTATVLTLLTCLIGTAVAAIPSSSAQSVTGPFVPAQSWWIGPGGTTGFVTDGVTITFDTNGDGLLGAGDHSHPLPQQIRYGTMVLSPTRRALIAWVDNPSLCGAESPVALWFYAIPAEDGASLELLNGPQCLGGFMGPMGFYEHPGASDRRICYVIEVGVGSEQQVFWVDLESGSGSFTQNPLSSSIESVAFAPSGIAAFVKHGAGGFDGLADYSLVNLCDGSLGSLVNPAGGGLFGLMCRNSQRRKKECAALTLPAPA
ncbi:MAG TPA: hypothetical protein VLC48_07305 [Gemmatimonadota bacterium]|nr:hypothetical protein [Gemmatimonadota bacterium]